MVTIYVTPRFFSYFSRKVVFYLKFCLHRNDKVIIKRKTRGKEGSISNLR